MKNEKINSFRIQIIIGFIIWLIWSTINFQYFLHNSWGRILLLFAPLFMVPFTLRVVLKSPEFLENKLIRKIKNWILPAAILLAISYLLKKGIIAAILSFSWLMVCLFIFYLGLQLILKKRNATIFGLGAGMIFLLVGGIWAFIDRAGWRPLDYDPEIVFLTVAHFHYAGFVLPIIAGLVHTEMKNIYSEAAIFGIISGVVLVALGIVNTQLGNGSMLESIAAWWLALSAILLAILQINIAVKNSGKINAMMCWSLGSIALMGGMALAGLYGIRHIYPVKGLDIPMMRFLHGSANVFGFSLFSVLGWWFYYRENK